MYKYYLEHNIFIETRYVNVFFKRILINCIVYLNLVSTMFLYNIH